MHDPMLFYTTVPVLLGGLPRHAGRLAAELYLRHGINAHWYGRGWHPRLAIYARRHPVALPFSEDSDGVMLRLLLDFEGEQRHIGGIPCLIPCSREAEDFLARAQTVLEERFVLLERPSAGEDPLYALVR